MKRFVTIFATAALALAAMSCLKEERNGQYNDAGDSFPVTVEVANPQVLPYGTKSSYTSAELNKITNLHIVVYHEGMLLKEYCRYFSPVKNVTMTFPGDKDGFNIYMVANMGEIDAPENESDMSTFMYLVSSYDDFQTVGFPMANVFRNYTKGSQTRFTVKRFVGQYDVTVGISAADAEYTVKDMLIYNCALDIYPFATTDIPATRFKTLSDGTRAPGDHLSSADITKANNGETISLYFLENLQGELMPGNTDPKQKVPENVPINKRDNCTYIEVVADIKTPAGQYTDGKYRFYLGSNATTDFSIRRSTLYYANLDFAQNMVTEEGWRIDVEKPTVIGKFDLSKKFAQVIANTEDMVYVTPKSGNHADLDFTVELDPSSEVGSQYLNFEVIDTQYMGKTCKGIHITTTYPVEGTYPVDESDCDYKNATILLKSTDKYNGNSILIERLPVRVYYKSFPILFKAISVDNSKSKLMVFIKNPMNLGFKITCGQKGSDTYTYGETILQNSIVYTSTGGWVEADYYYSSLEGKRVFSPDCYHWFSLGTVYNEDFDITVTPLTATSHEAAYASTIVVANGNKYTSTSLPSVNIGYPCFIDGAYFLTTGSPRDTRKANLGPRSGQFPGNYNLSDDKYKDDPKYGVSISNYKDYQAYLAYDANNNIKFTCTNAYFIKRAEYITISLKSQTSNGVFSSTIDGTSKAIYLSGCNAATSGEDDDMIPLNGGRKVIPFYISNGIQMLEKITCSNWQSSSNKEVVTNGLMIDLYPSGRDLYGTSGSASVAKAYHTLNTQKNMVGKHVVTWKGEIGWSSEAQTYMTVNGCSTWPNGSTRFEGISFTNLPYQSEFK